MFIITVITFAGYPQNEYIVLIDQQTHTFNKSSDPIIGMTFTYEGERAFNENNGTFFLIGMPNNMSSEILYTVNINNGNVISNPVISVDFNSNKIRLIHYSNIRNKLFCLRLDSNILKQFGSLNPNTGIFTSIGNPIPNNFQTNPNHSTIDDVNGYYIFKEDLSNTLYTIDVNTGNILHSPTLAIPSDKTLISIVHKNTNNTTYCLMKSLSSNNYFLATINKLTGDLNIITQNTFSNGQDGGSATIDEYKEEYIYSSFDIDSGYYVSTIDLTTGDLLTSYLFQPLYQNDNLINVKYDNTQKKLYAMHWGIIDNTSIIHKNITESSFKVYPNPTTGILNINTSDIKGNFEIQLINILGKVVFNNTFSNNQNTIDLTENGLLKGTYFLKINTENDSYYSKVVLR